MNMHSTWVEVPGPPLVMMRMESNTLKEPVVMVISSMNSCGLSMGRVILKKVLQVEEESRRAAS